jgi:hypothetical protein
MGLGNERAIADRFAVYIGELTKMIGHADREEPLRDYCSRLLPALRRQQPGADGGGDGAGARFGAASKASALCCQCHVCFSLSS